jgi:hypothetical protein
VTVKQGRQTSTANAIELNGAERDRVFAEQVRLMPIFGAYQAGTSRVIPVFELTDT